MCRDANFFQRAHLKDGAWWRYLRSCGEWDVWRVWGKRQREEDGQELAYRVLDQFSVYGGNGRVRNPERLYAEMVRSGEADSRFIKDRRGKLWLHLATVAEGRPLLVCRPDAFLRRHTASFVFCVLTDGERFAVLPWGPPEDGGFYARGSCSCPPLPPDLDPSYELRGEEKAAWWRLLELHRKRLRRTEKKGRDKVSEEVSDGNENAEDTGA